MAGYLGSRTSVFVNSGATAAQGILADTAVQPADNISTLTNDAGYLTAPFAPLAVTGTTPSLDVGTYNFFDNGTLSGDTTVTFASVPTEARWTYSFVGDLLTTYDLDSASFVQGFSVSAEDTNPRDLFFKPDGTKMYFAGNTGQNITEYSLSTAWDVSTASFVQSFSVVAQDTNPHGLFFKPDGTKMYVVGITGDAVYEYNLGTAWNISTASYVQFKSVATQDTQPFGIFFKPDGIIMYVVGNTGRDINQYVLSTAWDVSTASYEKRLSLAPQDTQTYGLFFKPDGTKVYITGNTGDSVYEYNLSTAWDVATGLYAREFSVAAEDTFPSGLFFNPDGTKMYVTGSGGDDVSEYDVFSGTTLTLPASVQNTPQLDSGVGDRVTYEFFTLDGGTNVYLIGEEVC